MLWYRRILFIQEFIVIHYDLFLYNRNKKKTRVYVKRSWIGCTCFLEYWYEYSVAPAHCFFVVAVMFDFIFVFTYNQ